MPLNITPSPEIRNRYDVEVRCDDCLSNVIRVTIHEPASRALPSHITQFLSRQGWYAQNNSYICPNCVGVTPPVAHSLGWQHLTADYDGINGRVRVFVGGELVGEVDHRAATASVEPEPETSPVEPEPETSPVKSRYDRLTEEDDGPV